MLQLACTKPGQPATSYTQVAENTGPKKTWLALGDSYTIGQGVTIAESFPAQTANLLKLSGINIGLPDYIATTGWTTNDLEVAIQTKNPGMYDVVGLVLVVNTNKQAYHIIPSGVFCLYRNLQIIGGPAGGGNIIGFAYINTRLF